MAQVFFLFALFTVAALPSEALPAFRRLAERAHGFPISCALCHAKGGGSMLNHYGVDFLKAGASRGALTTLSGKDSDHDSFPNDLELLAKSNPGDALSTPKSPGPWLTRIEATALPLSQLSDLFPGVTKFSSLDGSLYANQRRRIEDTLGAPLLEEDLLPTFYFAIEKREGRLARTGVCLFLREPHPKGAFVLGLAANLSGQINRLMLMGYPKGAKTLARTQFLKQFKGLSKEAPLHVGKDLEIPDARLKAEAQHIADMAKKALLIIHAVFAKR